MDERAVTILIRFVGMARFSGWVSRYSALADRVSRSLITLDQVQGKQEPLFLQAGREAANTLHMIAREAGFAHEASIFSVQYDQFCRALLPSFFETV